MELTDLGQRYFGTEKLLHSNIGLGRWQIWLKDVVSEHNLKLADGSLEIKALVDMGLIRFLVI